MKKLMLLSVVGLALAGCQSTGSFEQHSYKSNITNPVPDGSAITLQDTKNSVWKTTVKQDEFDGKTIISKVNSGSASLIVRYTESDDNNWANGFNVYYVNGDSHICSSGYSGGSSYVGTDVLIDGVKSYELPDLSTDRQAVFFYSGEKFDDDWLTKLAKGKKITIRINDGCGEYTKHSFNITGWSKELYHIQNPKIEKQAHLSSTGLDEFMYLTEGKHNEWCSYAKSVNYAEGQSAFSLFNKFWNTKEMRQYRLSTQTTKERNDRMLAWTALLEKRTGKLLPPSSEYFVYSKEMCAKL
jgi:hypothetical protein